MRKAFLVIASLMKSLVPSPLVSKKVQHVMTYHDIKLVRPEDSLLDAAQLMKQKDIGFLPVVFGDKLVGTLTDRDIVIRGLVTSPNFNTTKVRDAMSRKVIFCFNDESMEKAKQLMSTFQIRRLPVLRRDMNIAGIVSLGDLSLDGKAGQVLAKISTHTGTIRSMMKHEIKGVEQASHFDKKTKEKGLHTTQYLENNESLTPLNKIRNQLLQYTNHSEDKRFAIFISSGSYCPVHRMHTQIFEDAKDYMTKLGFTVIGGFLSPSHQEHLLAKLGDNAVSSYHRIKMAELATDDSCWISVSKWESSQDYMVNYDQVTTSIADIVSTIVRPLNVFYLCGADIALKGKLWMCGPQFKSIAICRPGTSSQLMSFLQRLNQEDEDSSHEQFNNLENTINKCFFLVESLTEDISSTVVRNRLSTKQKIDGYCHPAVVRYIKEQKLFKRTNTNSKK